MPLRLDEETKSLEIGVADFVDDREFFRIGFDRGDGLRRMWVGQAIHSRYQDTRMGEEPTYRREVPFSWELSVDEWTLRVVGRLDGLWKRPDGTLVVEEIKSTSFELDGDPQTQAPSSKLERARRQLLVYCHALAHQGGPEPAAAPAAPRRLVPVEGILVYVDIATGAVRRLPIPYEAGAVSDWIRQRVAEIVGAAAFARRRVERRAEAAGNLPFPHAQPRPGQEDLIAAVERTMDQGEWLLACAPTGIGKTAGVLHPALRTALATNRKLFVLTAKTLQQPLAARTLERMASSGWNAVRLRAKEKMCANGRITCHEELCRFAKDYPDKMESSGLVERLMGSEPLLEPDRLYDEAVNAEVCPFEVSLELAGRAEVVIADYNYVFDPDVALREVREPGALARSILVVDEAHNLVDRGREIFSPSLDGALLRRAIDACALRSVDLFERLAESMAALAALLDETADAALGPGTDGEARATAPVDALMSYREGFEALIAHYLAWKRETLADEEEDPILDVFFGLARLTRLLAQLGDDLVAVASRQDGVAGFRLLCLDPARFLAPVWKGAAGGVLMSATLRPPEFYTELLGLPTHRTSTLDLPSPFPPENRRVLIIPAVSTSWKHRERDAEPTAALVAELAAAVPGNLLALFPSYRFLADIVDRMPPVPQRVLRQRSVLTERERRDLLEALADTSPPGVLLAAVSGGLYAEGVDYPGESLRAVLVVSPALPQVSFEQELLREYFDERHGSGFDYAYVVPGIRRVVQSAGRVVRSATDRGLVALICRRFAEDRYRRHLPPEWFADGSASTYPPARAVRATREFFLEEPRAGWDNSSSDRSAIAEFEKPRRGR